MNAAEETKTIPERVLAEIVGVTTKRLRQLGAAGLIAAPVRGRYETVRVLKELFQYYRQRAGGAAADFKAQRARSEKRRADMLDLAYEKELKTLVPIAEVQQLISDTWVPIRQTVLAMPPEIGPRCNPTDPELATKILRRWVDDRFFPSVRAGIPQPNSTDESKPTESKRLLGRPLRRRSPKSRARRRGAARSRDKKKPLHPRPHRKRKA